MDIDNMAEQIKPGDIFEVVVPTGHAYLQFERKMPSYGHLIRVLPGVYGSNERPDLDALAAQSERFTVFYPLAVAVKQELVRKVGSATLPEWCAKFRPMLMAGARQKTDRGYVGDWWLWDGEKEIRLGVDVPDEYKNLSFAEVWTHPILVERIESDWSPEKYING
jgi:hypothetical protein